MPGSKIKAVLFDLGDTLVSFGEVSTTSLFRQSARLSYDYLKNIGQSVGCFWFYYLRNLISLRLRCLYSSMTGRDFDALELLKRAGRKHGITLTQAQWEDFAWLWYEPLSKLGKVESNIVQTLGKLKQLGLSLGIISNTFVHGSSLEKHLDQLRILEFFSVRLYSYQFKFRKPNPLIFEAAAEKIGQDCRDIVFVGDRIDADIKPALKLGMRAVLKRAYTNAGKPLPEGVYQISELSELPALIKNMNSN